MTRLCKKLTTAAIILAIGIGAWVWVMLNNDEYHIHYEEIE